MPHPKLTNANIAVIPMSIESMVRELLSFLVHKFFNPYFISSIISLSSVIQLAAVLMLELLVVLQIQFQL